MPKKMEAALKREATKKGLKGKRRNAYIYGAMRKTGWTPSTQKHVGTLGNKPKKK